MRAIVARPRPGGAAFAAALAERGIGAVLAPVLRIVARADATADAALADAQAVLLTSANGARALATTAARRRSPIVAVGDATASAARAAGFVDVRSVDGDSAALATFCAARFDPASGPLVHVGGVHTAGGLERAVTRDGFRYVRLTLYEAVAAETLPEAAATALRGGKADAAALFSPRSARIFVALARKARLDSALAAADAFCLSDAVATAAAAARWRRVAVSARPRADSLLGLMAESAGAGAPERRR